MKKFVIPIIAAAILGVGAGVTAVVTNRANVAAADNPGIEEVEVKSGKYYLNGDVNSGLWIVVTPETISLKGEDVDTSIKEAIAADLGKEIEEVDEEYMQTTFDADKLLFCDEKPYYARVAGFQNWRCIIHVDRTNKTTVENREDLLHSNAAFVYDDITDTINLGAFGDFTLVE